MAENKVSTLKKFFHILKNQKEEISSIYFYAIVNGLVQLSLPVGIQSIISFVLGGAMSTSLILLIILVIAGVFVAGLMQVNQMKIIEKIQQQLFVRYSFQYAHTIPNLNLKDVDGYYLPEVVNRFFDTISLQKGISKLLLDVPVATIQIFFGLVLLSFYHPVFILFGILLLTVLYFILRITSSKGMETSLQESNYKYMVSGYLQELARMIITFKFSRNDALHLNKTDGLVSGYLKARTSHFKILLLQYWTLIGFKVIITMAMLIVGTTLLIDQQINIGQFIAAEIIIIMVINSVEKLIVNLDKVYDVLTSVEKLTKLTDKPKELSGDIILNAEQGISFQAKNLSFSYSDEKQILKNLSFEINAGEYVCIRGIYSSGKSTLLKLLSGAYLSFEGKLLINEISISNYDINSLRSQSGVMLHTQDILHGTLKENICMGDDTITLPQIDNIARIVGLKDFIDNLKDGYYTELQPMGQDLSARIIKKILLLRALIHKPKLLLLEEPWLGLEEQYQLQIRKYLLSLVPSSTIIIVSNDAALNEECNKIIELEDGELKSLISTK